MIIPVKKIDILLHESNRDVFLDGLQEVGVVDINIATLDVTEELKDSLDELAQVEDIIKKLKPVENAQPLSSASEVVVKAVAIEAELETIAEDEEKTKQLISQLQPWGNFDPKIIQSLAQAGYPCRFWSINAKNYVPSSGVFQIASSGSSLLLFSVGKDSIAENADELHLELHSIDELQSKLQNLNLRKTTLENDYASLGANLDALCNLRDEMQKKLDLGKAKLIAQKPIAGSLLHYAGWIPESKQEAVQKYLDKAKAVYFFSEPKEEESVPVALKNGAFAKLFEPVTKIFALPDYAEIDPTPFFAPFFAFFFGMCLGDTGYGALLVIIGVVALMKVSQENRGIPLLITVLGTSTFVAGIFLNTFFGMAIFTFPGVKDAIFDTASPIAFLATVSENGQTSFPAMPFAMYLGVIQVILGILLKSFIKFRNNGLAYALQPIASAIIIVGVALVMIKINFISLGEFSIGGLHIGATLAALPAVVGNGITLAGVLLLLFVNSPEKPIYMRPLLGLWEIYTFSTGLMGDILSYLRLFALGLAGGLLGNAFNGIALMFITNADGTTNWSTPMVLVAALVFIIGHGINFCLSGLGAFVHPLRLTFVEFYKNLEFKGGARAFSPFKK